MPADHDTLSTTTPTPSRRSLLVGAGAVALTGLLGGCGRDELAARTAGESAGGGSWTFTDDRGQKISLPKTPQRIVAQLGAGAALWDFGIHPVGVFGEQQLSFTSQNSDTGFDHRVGNLDPSSVTWVGTTFGEFNVEKFLALHPDLLVTTIYGGQLWYVPPKATKKIEAIAPIAGIDLEKVPAPQAIARYGQLAEALGADLSVPSIQQAKADFEKASDNVRRAIKAKPGLKVAGVAANKESVWITKPEYYPDLAYLRQLGLSFVDPGGKEPFYKTLSWEQIGRYPADLLLYDVRWISPEQMPSFPATWQQHPAVRAGQVEPWRNETPTSYQAYTTLLNDFADIIDRAQPGVVA